MSMQQCCKIILIFTSILLGACSTSPELHDRDSIGFSLEELKQQAELSRYAGNHREALELYIKILSKDPSNVYALNGAGESLLAAEQPERADIYFERALKVDINNLAAREGRAISWLMQGNVLAAQKSFNSLIDDGVNSLRIWNAMGVIADLNGDYKEAAGYYQDALALDPKRSNIHNNIGYSLMMAHDYVAAEESLRRAIILSPGNERIANNLALSLAWQGRYDEAVEYLQRFQSKAYANNNIGYIAYLRKDYDVAEAMFRKAIRLQPTYYKRAAKNLELTLQKKHMNKK